MRYLDFKVTGQTLESVGDLSGLVPGTSRYLAASFEFSEEWNGCVKIVSFFDRKGNENAQLCTNGICPIPDDVTADKIFYIQLVGAKRDYRIVTNKVKVKQGG